MLVLCFWLNWKLGAKLCLINLLCLVRNLFAASLLGQRYHGRSFYVGTSCVGTDEFKHKWQWMRVKIEVHSRIQVFLLWSWTLLGWNHWQRCHCLSVSVSKGGFLTLSLQNVLYQGHKLLKTNYFYSHCFLLTFWQYKSCIVSKWGGLCNSSWKKGRWIMCGRQMLNSFIWFICLTVCLLG